MPKTIALTRLAAAAALIAVAAGAFATTSPALAGVVVNDKAPKMVSAPDIKTPKLLIAPVTKNR